MRLQCSKSKQINTDHQWKLICHTRLCSCTAHLTGRLVGRQRSLVNESVVISLCPATLSDISQLVNSESIHKISWMNTLCCHGEQTSIRLISEASTRGARSVSASTEQIHPWQSRQSHEDPSVSLLLGECCTILWLLLIPIGVSRRCIGHCVKQHSFLVIYTLQSCKPN